MKYQHLDPASEALADRLTRDSAYRVLREVPKPHSMLHDHGPAPDGMCIAIVDVETTGLNADTDQIIELAIMLIFVEDDGEIISHFAPLSWLQDPSVPLDPQISLVTGLTGYDLMGEAINDKAAFGLLDRADLIIAHNAKFDCAFIEERYPSIAGKPWACSCTEIDWLALGYDGRAQQHLLGQAGWFSNAHRAPDDVWSLFWLLQQRQFDPDGGTNRTPLARLIEAARTPSVIVQAERAPYCYKAMLKARGYSWNAPAKFWQRELPQEKVEAETVWAYREGLPSLTQRPVTACERHR